MTARTLYRRARAYARASLRSHETLLRILRGAGGHWAYRRGRWPELDAARDAEFRAWSRLPEAARLSILSPEGGAK